MWPDPAQLPPLYDVRNGRKALDWHLILFAINMMLVPMGYYFSIRFGALSSIKILRTALMGASLLLLAVNWQAPRYAMLPWRHLVLFAFVVLNMAVLPFAVLPYISVERLLTVLPFWVYTDVFAAYLRGRYGPQDGMRRMNAALLVYLFPVLIFYLSGNPFARLSIYGDESRGFVSNHFGWASAVSLGVLLDLRRRMTPSLLKTTLWTLTCLACLWLLLISGSRSSYLSLGVTLVFLMGGRRVGWLPRIGVIVAMLGAVAYLVGSQESALNQRYKKTERQLETIEPRLLSAQQAFHALDTHEERYLTGMGYDLYGEAIWRITGVYPSKAHNSYLELFVNCGALVFMVFLFGLLLPALFRYLSYDVRHWCMIPPLLIIPYFENNLGAGQFLFYPWMFVFFWYLHDARRGLAGMVAGVPEAGYERVGA